MKRFEKQGYWWLPSDPERRLPGMLVFGHDVDSELRLLGSMQEDFDALRMIGRGGDDFRPEIILGTSSDGKDYTLVYCLRNGFSMSAYVIESFLPAVVIEGRHFASVETIVIQCATVRLSHLNGWLQSTGRQVTWEEAGEGRPTLRLTYRNPHDVTASCGSGRISLGLDGNIQFARFGGDFVVSEAACMSVFPDEPLHMNKFLEECLPPITAFVSVGVGRPVSIHELRVKAAADCEGRTADEQRAVPSIQLFWKKKRFKGEEKELFPHEMVFTCPELGDKLEEHLTQWVRGYEAIKPVMQLFFGRVITTETVSANSFLNAVQAAEAYHRYRRDGTEFPQSEHKARLTTILEATPTEHRKWLKEKLCFSNEKSLGQRLTELLRERTDLLTISHEETEAIAKRAKDLRNFFTHYSGEKKLPFGTADDFYVLGTLMRWIVIACFLEEMGFRRECAHELLDRCEPFRYFRSVHLKQQQVEFFRVESVPASEIPKTESD